MKNPKNAGAKLKYKEEVKTKVIHPLIPTESESEILKSIDKITKKYQN